MSLGLFKNVIFKICLYKLYMYKQDLALNNLQALICHKTQPTTQPTWWVWGWKFIIYFDALYHKNYWFFIKFLKYLNTLNSVVFRRADWKVHRLIKMLSWNVTKWGLFFNTAHHGPLWCGVVVPDRVLSIELKYLITYDTWNHLTVCKQNTDVKLNY